MNVHHLELFYYVAKHEGITAAVTKMPYGIQQPAVSGQILQLEKKLGVKLFNRRPFALTKAGEDLYDYIYPFFSKLSRVEAQLTGKESQTLRLAASATILKNHLPIVLGVMKQESPDLALELKHVEPEDVEELVRAEVVDLGVSVVAGKQADSLKVEPLLEITPQLLIPAEWEELSFDELLQPDEYQKGRELTHPVVGLGENQILTKVVTQYFREKQADWTYSVQVDAIEVISEYVTQGFGVGVSVAVPGRKLPKGVRAIPMPDCPSLTLAVVYQGKLKPVGLRFIEKAKEAARVLSQC